MEILDKGFMFYIIISLSQEKRTEITLIFTNRRKIIVYIT